MRIDLDRVRRWSKSSAVGLDTVEPVFYGRGMSPKQLTAFRMPDDVMAGLRAVKARDGVPISTQVEFALRAWLKTRGVGAKTKGKQAAKETP